MALFAALCFACGCELPPDDPDEPIILIEREPYWRLDNGRIKYFEHHRRHHHGPPKPPPPRPCDHDMKPHHRGDHEYQPSHRGDKPERGGLRSHEQRDSFSPRKEPKVKPRFPHK